jgi:hypothetical protein
MSDRLAKLEARIEQFVEGTLTRLLAGRLQAREVAVRLARAMEDNAQPGPRDTRLAPTHYQVRLNPSDEAAIRQSSPDLINRLTAELVVFARELNLALPSQPVIRLEADDSIEAHEVVVQATAGGLLSETRPVPIVSRASANPTKAFLIVNGDRHVPLNRAVVTLGRKLDNTIIVDDPRVSRHHAQLRQKYGRWILYDLGSASGTFVNNHKVEECLLQPGDVISLSGATLIYAEEELTEADGDTGGTLPTRAESEKPIPKKDEGEL